MAEPLVHCRVDKVCRKCGATLLIRAKICSACLLEAGLEDGDDQAPPAIEPKTSSMFMHFGDYELLEEIGRGGQGVVYRARQKSLNRLVALKVIALGTWATETHLKRFRAEAKAAAQLDDPCIVPIYEIGERSGCCYFSMKLIDGGQLDEVVRRAPMALRSAAELIAKLARTIHYAHERGILHRDIKPGNILFDKKGEPHLADFGLARLVELENNITRTIEVLGTPSYMAPEQAMGHTAKLTRATDVYGLGAVLYQLLSGQPPFAGGTTYKTIRLVVEADPRHPRLWNPKVDADLATICLKCLEKDPAKRYETAAALAEDLERWLRDEPIRARSANVFTRAQKWIRRNRTTAALTFALAALAVAFAITRWNSQADLPPAAGLAVLPFENLSGANESASLVEGLQDDILTRLAKIADLKVISRTSVMSYRDPRDVRKIGQGLNVSNVLEGSVRKTGSTIHLNVQLIDTRTDTHLWAEQYDYDVSDAFAIQSEVAQEVARQLHAKVSTAEKLSLERPPTADLAAFDLYTRSKNLFPAATNNNSGKQDLLEAADLLNQATARDPSYFEAYCQLAAIHDSLYLLGHDHSPRRLALAEDALNAALRLRPNAGESHLARATHLYSGYLNYDGALVEVDRARQSLPNDCRVLELFGRILIRRGKPEEALRAFQHVVELDPRNIYRLQQVAGTYWFMRRYPEARIYYDRALAIEPNNAQARIFCADLDLAWKADTRGMHEAIDSLRATNPDAIRQNADSWVLSALADRDATATKAALIAAGENTPLNQDAVHFNRLFVEGWIARLEKDETKAHAAFEAARAEQEKIVAAHPDYAPTLGVLGVMDAMLGRKEEAMSECRRAAELLPLEKDALNGMLLIEWYAVAAAWVGEKNLAIEQLTKAVNAPGLVGYGYLKLLPFWDPLRGDPRFEKIVASLAPNEKAP